MTLKENTLIKNRCCAYNNVVPVTTALACQTINFSAMSTFWVILMARILLLLYSLALISCGTINTVLCSEQYAVEKLNGYETNCYSIQRVYSGLLHDLCILNSSTTDYRKHLMMGFFLFDTLPSVVVDTVILPYTIYSQYHDGSIRIKY